MQIIRWTLALTLALSAAGQLEAAQAGGTVPVPSIQTLRTSDSQLARALEEGVTKSSTLRQLEARLQGCSVIVYLARAALPTGVAGRTRIMGSGGGWRYLSIEVSSQIRSTDLLWVLGHELQHAVEIANAPEVVDERSLTALYRRIGTPVVTQAKVHSFETREAMEAGRRVEAEVMGWSSGLL